MSTPPPATPVTATICNYNGRDYLVDCIASLLRQSHPLHRIRLYDNASQDGSVALVRERFPAVEVVEMGENAGPCPVRNRGLVEADTAWVLQIDSDVILEEHCVERLLAEATAPGSETVALVMPRAVFHGEPDRVHYDGGSFHYIGVMTLRNFFRKVPPQAQAAADVDAAIAMALLVRRDVVLGIGAYDPAFFILFEDHDLCYRLRAAGWRVRWVPGALVYHREGTAGISYRRGDEYPSRRAFLHSRNRWLVLLRDHSTSALLAGLPGILCYELVWVVFAAFKGNLGAWLRGKRELLRLLPQVRRDRRRIQSARKVSDRELLHAEPLTHAPMVKRGWLFAAVERGIDLGLRAWWWVARWAVR